MRVCRYEVGYVTHPGNVRTGNQDSLLIRRGSVGEKEFLLLAVADGMGGLARGGEASASAMACLNQWWTERLPQLVSPTMDWSWLEDSLCVAVESINWSLYQQAAESGQRSGTTLSMMFLYQGEYRIFQVGDSRVYHIRSGELEQLTRDQTWCQMEVDAGRMTPEEALTHPQRHVLTSTLGAAQKYTLELLKGRLESGESALLCSDGFYHELPEQWPGKGSEKQPVQELLEDAARHVLLGTASDNLTAVQVRMTKSWR